jgi:mRNA interferase MazF
VLLLSRDEAYAVRELVTVAPLTTRVRGIPSEVPLDRNDGVPRACAINLDTITTIPKALLGAHLSTLTPLRMASVDRAIRYALGLV